MSRRHRVGLIFGGRSVEHAVSLNSARTVRQGLVDAGYGVVCLAIGTDGSWWSTVDSARALDDGIASLGPSGRSILESLHHLLRSGVDSLFPLVHGTWGEDGTLQGLCEMLDLPYAGADVATSAVAMDKDRCKRLLSAVNVPVVADHVVHRAEFEADPAAALAGADQLLAPWFVKPSVGGSSVGVSRVETTERLEAAVSEAFRFDDKILIEEGVNGAREIECAVLDGEVAEVLGEIVPGREFYDYEDKYLADTAQLIAPARLSEERASEIRELAHRAFAAAGGEGMARVDFLLAADGRLFLNELNTVPGFTAISMFPRLWQLSGRSLAEVVGRLVEGGISRHRRRRALDRGIKSWIAALGDSAQGS